MNGMNCSGFWRKIRKAGAELLAWDARTCAVCGRDIREGAVCRECARQLAEARILRAERLSGISLYSCYRYDACVRTILLRFNWVITPGWQGPSAARWHPFCAPGRWAFPR